ncbi:MAG: glycoside hydrolase family 36 protein [Terriglobia bacterium]
MKTRMSPLAHSAPFVPIVLLWLTAMLACEGNKPAPSAVTETISSVAVTVNPGGPMTIKTQVAEFEIASAGYIKTFLLQDGKRQTLDDSTKDTPGGCVVISGKEVCDFALDFSQARVSDTQNGWGGRGKRVEIPARSRAEEAAGIEEVLAVEVHDGFPALALTESTFKNAGTAEIQLDQVTTQAHRLNACLADRNAAPYAMWSFSGASYDWGKGEIVEVGKGFARPSVMGAISASGAGGGVPVVAFWTKGVGLAVGHAEPKPLTLSIPAKVAGDGRVEVSVRMDPARKLRPGDTYATPLTFVAVYSGDYYEPLRAYSQVLARRGSPPAQPNPEDFAANWCGWGYRSDVTPAQMLGTIPKLKELGFRWATLDYRWFNNFGDWEPRPETFTRESIKKVVDEYHRQGLKLQLWWLPLAVSDGLVWEPIGPEERSAAAREQQKIPARVFKEHPDWLILDRKGKPARLFLNRAALCPALPAVVEYHRQLTEKFIRDWNFDGHKLDMCFTVPACYNPAHHHASPEESTLAMGAVFKAIYETTKRLKPESVTQICPCGTTPNIAFLPYMDQAVTADPVGALQVRRRIKMYKALLGPESAVYGDHVELSEMHRVGQEYVETGSDFASTVGTGGVLGTKFTWPDYGPAFKDVFLTPEKESQWKKWVGVYNSKMLSRGTFLNLYTLGYDLPEGYAIAKDGKMYYAFFSPDAAKPWKGEIELRGLEPGKYRVVDYVAGKELGAVTAPNARLAAEFTHHLLLELSRL